MREIEFRGKRMDSDEWVYGYYFYDDFENKHYILQAQEDDTNPFMWEVIPEAVGQYTGIKDINDKEIYEGDIISGGSGKVPTLIKWDNKNNCWMAFNLKRKEEHDFDKHFKRYINEVIGNIYDNPELLESEIK